MVWDLFFTFGDELSGTRAHAWKVSELRPPFDQARPQGRIGPLDEPVVERQDVVPGRLDPEEVLELPELPRVLRGQVDGLTEVVVQVVELPHVGGRSPVEPRFSHGRRPCRQVAAIQPSS